jgi:hypothetical protein
MGVHSEVGIGYLPVGTAGGWTETRLRVEYIYGVGLRLGPSLAIGLAF